MSYDGQDDFISLSIEPHHKSERLTPEPHIRDDRAPERTQEEKLRFTISCVLLFLGYPVAFFAALLALLSAFSFYGTHNLLDHWPHVIAEVNSCDVYVSRANETDARLHSSFVYVFRCEVIYGSQSLPQHAVADIGYQTSSRGEMWTQWSNRIHRGDHVEIVYDPSNLERANFAGDFSTAYAVALHLLKIDLWVGMIALLMIFLGRRLRPNAPTQLST